MPQHGDWKQLFRAAGDGDVAEMAYHITAGGGVDVNFQHPEYMSSALCQAARAGHVAAVQCLLAHGADPYQAEYYSDQLPLQLALDERRHDVVDVLLDAMKMKEDDDSATATSTTTKTLTASTTSIIQTIWLDTHDDALVTAVANTGHCVVWSTPGTTDDTRLARVRQMTGNRKIVASLDHHCITKLWTRTKSSPGNSGPTVHVAFIDNRGIGNEQGGNRTILDRLLGQRKCAKDKKTNVVAAGERAEQLQQEQMFPMNAERLILAQQPFPVSERTTTAFPVVTTTPPTPTTAPVAVVLGAPPPTDWGTKSWSSRTKGRRGSGGGSTNRCRRFFSYLNAVVIVGDPTTTSSSSAFVEAALATIFPVPSRLTADDDKFEF